VLPVLPTEAARSRAALRLASHTAGSFRDLRDAFSSVEPTQTYSASQRLVLRELKYHGASSLELGIDFGFFPDSRTLQGFAGRHLGCTDCAESNIDICVQCRKRPATPEGEGAIYDATLPPQCMAYLDPRFQETSRNEHID